MSTSTVDLTSASTRVLLIGDEPWGTVAAADLAVSGCAVTRSIAPGHARADLIVSCLSGDDLVGSQAVARLAHAAGVTSISAHLDGLDAVLGPVVVPGKTACWECCRLRRLANSETPVIDRALHAALLSERPRPRAPSYPAPAPALLGHALALAVLRLVASAEDHPLLGRIMVQDLVTLETEVHAVLPMPHCVICGGAFSREPAAPEGNGADIGSAADPAALRRLLAGVVDRRTGIVRSIAVRVPSPPMEPELPIVASAIRSRFTEGMPSGHVCEPEMGSGKGDTRVRAIVSAVGEAVERYSAARFHRPALVRVPVADMRSAFLSPADLCPYADRQHDEPGFPYPRLSPSTPIDWVRGFWLDDRSPVMVPALPVYMDYPAPREAYFCEVTSNGLGAGPTLDAAALAAALELCERDAFMIAWLARRPGRRVILDASAGHGAREALQKLQDHGVRVELYLLDAGLGIPVVACVGYGDGERWPGAVLSLSAHLRPGAAIAGALLEQGHFGPYLGRIVAQGKHPIPARPEDVRTLLDHALYYVPPERAAACAFLGAGGEVAASEIPDPGEASIDVLVRHVRGAGLRIAIVDVTSPDLAQTPFRVARAMGTGFQQIHFGHRLARLGNPRLLLMAPHGTNPDPHPFA